LVKLTWNGHRRNLSSPIFLNCMDHRTINMIPNMNNKEREDVT
jgi:hypothetical protein